MARSMRLAVVTNILAPYRVPLFEELARRCELLVLLLADRHANRDWTPPAVSFKTRTLPGLRLGGGSVDPIHLNVGTWSALREFRPDVVLGGGFTPAHLAAMAYCRLQRTRYISWGELFLPHESEALVLRRWVRHAAVRASDGWIASSSDTRDAFVHYGADAGRVQVSLMPVRNALFRALAAGARASGATDALRARFGTPLICAAGRLVAQKGWSEMLEAFREVRKTLPGCALVIAGDGPERARFESRAAAAGLSGVHFLGSCDISDLATMYAAADVFTFPSLCDPFGAVLAEAIACDTVAVSSIHAAATRDLVIDGSSGFAVDPRDTAAFASALCRVLKMPASQRQRMSALASSRLPADDICAGAEDILAYCGVVTTPRIEEARSRNASPMNRGPETKLRSQSRAGS